MVGCTGDRGRPNTDAAASDSVLRLARRPPASILIARLVADGRVIQHGRVFNYEWLTASGMDHKPPTAAVDWPEPAAITTKDTRVWLDLGDQPADSIEIRAYGSGVDPMGVPHGDPIWTTSCSSDNTVQACRTSDASGRARRIALEVGRLSDLRISVFASWALTSRHARESGVERPPGSVTATWLFSLVGE